MRGKGKNVSGETAAPARTGPAPPEGLAALWRMAEAKGLCPGGADECARTLESFGADLFGPGWRVDAGVLRKGASGAGGGLPFDWRGIGDRFWREGGSREERRLAGSFYTPERVIDRILDSMWTVVRRGAEAGEKPVPLCDPALGCGFFFLRLADRLRADGVDGERLRGWAGENLYGVDKEAAAVFLARALLWLSLSEPGRPFFPDSRKLRCGDSLLGPGFGESGGRLGFAADFGLDWARAFPEVAAGGGFGGVLGNPPYEVLTNFARHPAARELAERIRGSGWYRDSLNGQINLYRCFIERSLGLLRPGGMLSFVVPFSLARDGAAEALRRRLLLAEAAAEWTVYDEGEGLFPGVTQSACVFTARRGGGVARRIVVMSARGNAVLTSRDVADFGGGVMALPEANGDDLALWRWLRARLGAKLEDFAEMRVGEVDQTVFRDCMRDGDSGCLLARGAHVRPFHLDVRPLAGRERFLDLPRFLAKKGRQGERCRERASRWRVVQLGIRNMRTRPRLVAALAPPGVYLGNSLNVYEPCPGVSAAFLCAVLNSRLLDWMFRLGSGNNNINLREMAGLPFPDAVSAQAAGRVEAAFERCREAADGGGVPAAARLEMDLAVEECFRAPRELLDRVFGDSGIP